VEETTVLGGHVNESKLVHLLAHRVNKEATVEDPEVVVNVCDSTELPLLVRIKGVRWDPDTCVVIIDLEGNL